MTCFDPVAGAVQDIPPVDDRYPGVPSGLPTTSAGCGNLASTTVIIRSADELYDIACRSTDIDIYVDGIEYTDELRMVIYRANPDGLDGSALECTVLSNRGIAGGGDSNPCIKYDRKNIDDDGMKQPTGSYPG